MTEYFDIKPHDSSNNADSYLVQALVNLGKGKRIKVVTPIHNPLESCLVIKNLANLRTPKDHKRVNCQCLMCCKECNHYE